MALILAVASCSGASAGDAGTPSDGGTGGGVGNGGGTGGGSAAGGGSSMAGPSTVTLSQICTRVSGSQQCSFAAAASFEASSSACTASTLAGCELTDCVSPTDGGVAAVLPSKPAGTLTFGGTHLTDGGIQLLYGDGGYATASGFGKAFDALAILTVSATGDIVPGFGMQPLVAPNDATLTAPSCAGQLCGTANILEPLAVTWSGGAGDDLLVSFTSVSALETRSAVCRFSSSPGSIDSAVLLKLGPDADGYVTTFQAYSANTNTFSDGSYSVSFTALSASDGSSGRINLSD